MHEHDEYAPIADLYDHVVLYRDRPDVTFYVDAAKEASGPVLEIGCGTGRVLIPTARAGVDITGLDASPRMLDVCRNKVAAESAAVRARIDLVLGDMRAFALARTFALVTIPFRPFQHLLTVDDQLACLASIRRHLVPGGRLILDLFNPSIDALANRSVGGDETADDEFDVPDGRHVARFARTVARDLFAQTFDAELIYYVTHPDGRMERLAHAFPMRYLFRFEAEHLLARAGFVVEHVYAGYDKSPYGSTYPGELLMVARVASDRPRE